MRRLLCLLAALLLLTAVTPGALALSEGGPYADVNEDLWSYEDICALKELGVLPDTESFYPGGFATRGEFVSWLYGLHLALGGRPGREESCTFMDLPFYSACREAVAWAAESGVAGGVSSRLFAPNSRLTREQLCAMLLRFARYEELSLWRKAAPAPFFDSLKISPYARSGVTACQMAGIAGGYADGRFRPQDCVTRQECAVMLRRLWDMARTPRPAGAERVSCEAGFYDGLYALYPVFEPLVPACESVDLSYFDNVVFVGDSVSVTLQWYCQANGALGGAQFLCSGSLSATNALWPVSSQSVHPSYNGRKLPVEDGVAECGADIVYIMLGVNNVSFGVDRAVSDMLAMIDNILARSPDVQIIIQSVTPMTATSAIRSNVLNNEVIARYNRAMYDICLERGWYYLDVAEAFADGDGFLSRAYCSDPDNMGIHLTSSAAAVWVEYLKTHVPARLLR